MTAPRATVVVLQKSLPHHRCAFFDGLRSALGEHDVDLRLLYGAPRRGDEAMRRDRGELLWAERLDTRSLRVGGRSLVWQPALSRLADADLVIVEQAAKLLVNYPLLTSQLAGTRRVGFWGHGANLQRIGARRGTEALKRSASRLPHWWFAYTEGARARVEAMGYPVERITVVQNAVDAVALRRWRSELRDDDVVRVRAEL